MSNLLERAIAGGTPLIEAIDEQTCKVTFVWQGTAPAPDLKGDFTMWNDSVALEETEPGVWTYSLNLPNDVYAEYAYSYNIDIEERCPDPFNPRRLWNGIKAYNNYFTGPSYTPTTLTRRGAGVKRGALSEHFLEAFPFLGDTHRQIILYTPPTDEPVPLVVVWDGPDYLNRAYLNAIVDNLIAEGTIRPIALAFLYNGNNSRFVEYLENEASLFFVMQKVFPFVRERINLIDERTEPGIHGLLGASLGGLMALFGGLRIPPVFGHVLTQSGAFGVAEPYYELAIHDLVRQSPALPLKIWQDVGTLEDLLESNRKMNALLKEKGYEVQYTEYHGGHNYTMWADYVGEGLKYLYGKQR